jgi:hypothetical protein
MCQIAENVIKSMQDKLGEAKSMHDERMQTWCNHYIQILRDLEIVKFDQISAKVFEFMDVHTKLTPEQIAKNQAENKRSSKGDQTRKEFLKVVEKGPDLMFAIWANVLSRNQYSIDLPFGNYTAQLPQKQASGQIVLRTLWTSYDYLTANKI